MPSLFYDTREMPWAASPSASVWRKRLEKEGPEESARVTSVVRYEANARFASHPHPEGEEILVLSGVFSDEHGDYPAGSYLLNPEGFSHAPRSSLGCELFVKLRQYAGPGRETVRLDIHTGRWRDADENGIATLILYQDARFADVMRMLRFAPRASMASDIYRGGAEIFVVEGSLDDGERTLSAGGWARYEPGASLGLRSDEGALCYFKTDHLG